MTAPAKATPEIQCNGLDMSHLAHPIIPKAEYTDFNSLIDLCREEFLKQNKMATLSKDEKFWNDVNTELLAGYRFKSNGHIMDRIVSACTDRAHFDAHKAEWVMAALRDCAEADHWYEFEKDWGEDR